MKFHRCVLSLVPTIIITSIMAFSSCYTQGLHFEYGISAGTLANIIDLLRQGKECFVYVLTEMTFTKFDTEDALVNAISNHKEAHTEAVKRLASYDKRIKNRLKEVIDDQQSLF